MKQENENCTRKRGLKWYSKTKFQHRVQKTKVRDRGIENQSWAQGYEKRDSRGGVLKTRFNMWGTENESHTMGY